MALTVLIVEDEPIIRMALADHIASHGYQVLEAGSGDRALELLGLPETIDVLVTDVQMPGKHDGIALALWTRRNLPHIRIIIVSGATAGSPELAELGPEGKIISKPYPFDTVLARISALLEDEETMRPGPSHIPAQSGKDPLS